jgi:hypothetical protein
MCNVTLLNPEHQQLLYIKTDFFFSIQLCVSGSVSLFIGRRALVRLEGKKSFPFLDACYRRIGLELNLMTAYLYSKESDDSLC